MYRTILQTHCYTYICINVYIRKVSKVSIIYLFFMSSNNGTVVYPCLECGQTVRPRQEAIQCENCSFWQQRKCNTNITRECYWRAARAKKNYSGNVYHV